MDVSGEFEKFAEQYVNAANRDEALRHTGLTVFTRIDSIREVPEHEGRGWLWRLWRRFVKG